MDWFSICLIVACAVLFGGVAQFSGAQTVHHVVGDGMGWAIPTTPALSYNNWVSGRTFRVGDILEFNFVTNQHDVVRVPEASFNACSDENAIGDTNTTGPVNITLDSIGDHYYICTFGTHCVDGQRLSLTTVASSSSSTPAGPNPPEACAPTTTPTAGGPAAAMAPPPPPNSASGFFVPDAFFVFLTLSAGFFFLVTLSTAAAFFLF